MSTNDEFNILNVDVENLADTKYRVLHQRVLNIIDTVREHIINGEYDKVDNFLAYSSSGDGWGSENYYINFGWNENEPKDISQVCCMLDKLKRGLVI